jgi:hypothetical protein
MSNKNENQTKVQKKVISYDEFEKRVEIEAANLMYFEYMNKEQAFEEARKYITTKFVVKNV